MYTLIHLDTFLKVADTGSFNKAAEVKYLSTNSIMKHIDLLEKELQGAKLFERTHTGIKITAIGTKLYEDATEILKICEESKSKIISFARQYNSTIRLSIPSNLMSDFLQRIIERVHEEYPDFYIERVMSASTQKEAHSKWLNFDEWTDIAFELFSNEDFTDGLYSDLEGYEVYKRPLYCICSKHNPLSRKEIISIEDLRDVELNTYHGYIDYNFCKLNEEIRKRVPGVDIKEHAYFEFELYNYVANSNAVIIDTIGDNKKHPLIDAIPLDYKEMSYGFIYKKEASKKVNLFMRLVQDVMAECSKAQKL